MKKKITSILLFTAMLISAMPQVIVNAAEEITISTAAELKSFADSVNAGDTYEGKTVSLTQDIDLSEICGADINGEEVSWTSIGTMENGFSGLFDGNGHKITNLYINGNGNGLFGFCYGIIEDLNVEGSVICAAADLYFAGGIAGGLLEGIIRRCSFSGSVEGESHVGGIVGMNGGQITDCFNTGTVTALHCGGGIAGTNDGGSLIRCYNTGNIQKAASEYVTDFFGSITGGGDGSTISDCYYLEGTADDGAYMTSGDDTTTAFTLAQFADKNSFANWDFDTVWEMSAELGRPTLRSGNANSSSIIIGAPLTDCSYIGIYSDFDATEESPLTITGANDADYSKYFHSDNSDYKIINGENNSIQLIYDKDGRAYPYTVTEITIFNLDTGNSIHYIPKNKEFVIGINVHKNVELDEYAFIICALYDTDGALMGIYPVKMKSSSEVISYAEQIPAQDRNVGSIKAFVWDSFNSMKPLAEAKTLSFFE